MSSWNRKKQRKGEEKEKSKNKSTNGSKNKRHDNEKKKQAGPKNDAEYRKPALWFRAAQLLPRLGMVCSLARARSLGFPQVPWPFPSFPPHAHSPPTYTTTHFLAGLAAITIAVVKTMHVGGGLMPHENESVGNEASAHGHMSGRKWDETGCVEE